LCGGGAFPRLDGAELHPHMIKDYSLAFCAIGNRLG
jgi:hypothetical protein